MVTYGITLAAHDLMGICGCGKTPLVAAVLKACLKMMGHRGCAGGRYCRGGASSSRPGDGKPGVLPHYRHQRPHAYSEGPGHGSPPR